ncbi:MAG: hypothetical protein KAW12_25145 [Candidatus Aminicenantes bacterium]|nr:hypothetical protein [Candidatus Aminicenantes bacterium]
MKTETLNNKPLIGPVPGDIKAGGKKREKERDFESGAIYFLSFVIIVILTFFLFKSKILHFVFSNFL